MNKIEQAGNPGFEPLSQRVARRLRARMAELQLRGTDVAAAIGMTQGSFSRRFTGSAAWELDELELLEARVGISMAYLLGWESPAEPATGAMRTQQRRPDTPTARAGEGPAAEDPPERPQLRYADPTPIRFDAGAWPGDPRPAYSASA